MKTINMVRVVLALTVVVINILAVFAITLVLGLPCRPLRKLPLFCSLWRVVEQVPWLWNMINWKVACEGILRMKFVVEGEAPPLPAGAVRIYMANHPTFIGFLPFGYSVTSYLRNLIVLVMKREILWHVLVGFPAACLWMVRAAVFINRKNREAAFEAMRRAVKSFTGQRAWVCFAD